MTLDYTRLSFPDPPADRPYVAINMVMSADGRTVVEGTERGLGSAEDQRLMRELRVHFDVVANGAATFRASGASARLGRADLERWRRDRGMSASPISAVITASGDLPAGRRFFTDHSFDAVIYLSDAAPESARRELESRGRPVVLVDASRAVRSALSHMHKELGARRVLVEGGASLNGALVRAGLVDEFFLTVSPKIVGGESSVGAVSWNGAATRDGVRLLELVAAAPAPSGELFLRYRVSGTVVRNQEG